VKGDDGFLVLDANHNGRIDDISEMFGGVGASGFAELSALDSDHDGKITMADAVWAELKVWRDLDQDAVTDAGELFGLDALGIVSLDLATTAIDVTTPQGARLTARGDVTFAGGITRRMFDAVLELNDTDTVYAGESGAPLWQNSTLDAKGFGRVTDLSVAMANDAGLATLAVSTAAAMVAPDMRTLVAQAGAVLGRWGSTLEQSRELYAVKLSADGTQLLERKAWDGSALESGWRLEQGWSPADRVAAPARAEAPYLVRIESGPNGARATVLDYAVKQTDGTWALASELALGAGAASFADVTAVMASAHGAGTEWRVEDIQTNPYAQLPVSQIGVRFTDGVVVDYTVEVTDKDGTFTVWARNLDRALQLEWKTGDSRGFNLRNYAVDLANLDEAGSADDSTYRVELLTPAQFHFATSLGGIDFQPQMLTASLDNGPGGSGHLAYAVGPSGEANLSSDPAKYVSGVAAMIGLLQPVMEQYITASRRFAVRLALQGGLKDFARGIEYDVASDTYRPVPVVVDVVSGKTANRELAPLFEAIFAGAPASNAGDAVTDYLTAWNEVLWQIYPDYKPAGTGNLLGGTVAIDQAFILQMLLPAFESAGLDLDLAGVAHALSIDETRIISHAADAGVVEGSLGTDFFYMSASAPGSEQTYRGGAGADYYFVGKGSGNDRIYDQDLGDSDELRFTDVRSDDVHAWRQGEDLILEIRGRTNSIRLVDQFLGENNGFLSNGKQFDTGVNAIVFADGVVWDRFRMSMEVVDKDRAAGTFNDSLMGSGSADILWGGKGNDYMSGGAGGDFYIYARGDGQDVIDDKGAFSFGAVKAGIFYDAASVGLRFAAANDNQTDAWPERPFRCAV
jgi:hypothetical protein